MKINNIQVKINLSTFVLDLSVCGSKDDITGEIKLTTLTRQSTVGDYSDGCSWMLEYDDLVWEIKAQLEAL
jgi:hypothetical protein